MLQITYLINFNIWKYILLLLLFFSFESFSQNLPTENLKLWFKADNDVQLVDNGDGSFRVSKWLDQSGNNYYLENTGNTSTISLESSVINGEDAILFPDASHIGLVLKNSSDVEEEIELQNYAVYIVLKAESNTGDIGFYLGGSSTRALYGYWNNAQFYFRGPDNNLAKTDKTTWPISDNWGLISFQRNTLNTTNFTANGGVFSDLPLNTTDTNTHKLGNVGCGNKTSNLGWDGYIAELIVYESSDASTRLRVNDYLTSKYGLSYEEFSDTDELFGGAEEPNQFIQTFGYDNDAAYTPLRGNPSNALEITTNAATNNDNLIVGETNEGGLDFENAPTNQRVWAKKFFIEKSGAFDFDISFNIQNYEGKDNTYSGERTTSDYRLVYSNDNASTYIDVGVNATFDGSDKVKFTVSNSDFIGDGYYTLSTTAPDAFYTSGSGNWTDTNIWTKNPSGAADATNTYPTSADNVVILSGKTITLPSDNIEAAIVEVGKGGTLKVGTTVGHNFLELNGKGTIDMVEDNFPSSGTAILSNGFLTENGGIVKLTGTGTTLSTNLSYNIIHIDLDNTSDKVILSTDLSLTDSININTGTLVLGTSDNSNIATHLSVAGNVRVASSGIIEVGTDDVIQNVELSSSLYNAGNVSFTNRTTSSTFKSNAYLAELDVFYGNNLSGGYGIVTFNSDNIDQTIECNGSTIFYQIVIDKGTTDYYNLHIEASDDTNFEMYGYNEHDNNSTGVTPGSMTTSNGMFVLKYGTLHFGSNIYIPVYANTPNNYDLGIGSRLWVDVGADVNFGVVNALTVYGSVLVTGGRLNIGLNADGTSNGKHNSITLREKGYLVQEGGEVYLNQIKTSIQGEDHQGSVTISGGEMTIYGYTANAQTAAFSLPYNTNVFNMSGGKITIHNQDADLQFLTKFAMDDGYYNVTGGEIIFDINTDQDAYFISSIPFFDLTVKTDFPSRNLSLSNSPSSFGHPIPNDGNLNVFNDLVIENSSNLQIGNFDVTISGDLTLYDECSFVIGSSNLLTFNGADNYLDIRDTDESFSVDNLLIDMPTSTSTFSIKANDAGLGIGSSRLKVLTSLTLSQGILDYDEYVIEVEGNLENGGLIGEKTAAGHIRFNGTSGVQTITSVYDLVDAQIADTTGVGITHLWLNNEDGIELSKMVYTPNFTWEKGVIKANEYGLIVGPQGINDTSGNPINNFSDNVTNKRMVVGSGNSSDGGLVYLVQGNGTYTFPLASDFDTPIANSYKFTPATLTVTDYTTDGYIKLTPVNSSLVAWTKGGSEPNASDNLLDYHWKSDSHGYLSDDEKPVVSWIFTFDAEDIVNDKDTYVPGRVQLESDNTERENLGSTSDVDTDVDFTITTLPVKAYNALYSAGAPDKFTESLKVYYSFRGIAKDNNDNDVDVTTWEIPWNDNRASWTTNADWKNTGNPYDNQGIPAAGDIAIIGYGKSNNSSSIKGHRVKVETDDGDVSVGIIRFDSHESASLESANLAKVQVYKDATLEVGVVEDIGAIRLDSEGSLIWGDMNDYLSEERSELMLQSSILANEIPIFPKYPSLRLWGGNNPNKIFEFPASITETIQIKNILIDGAANFVLNKSIDVEGTINIGGNNYGILDINSSDPLVIECQGINMENVITSNGSVANKFKVTGEDDIEHRLIVKGNISIPEIDAGESGEEDINFSLINDVDRNRMILELQGEDNKTFTNFYSSTIVPELYKVVINKGSSKEPTFTFNTNFTLPSITSEELITFSNGTLVIDNDDINITPFAVGATDWSISSTAGLTINQGTVNMVGDGSNLILGGKLHLQGGTLNLSNIGQENSVVYAGSGELEINGGTINIGSELRRDINVDNPTLKYNQTGGIINSGIISNPNSATRGSFEIIGTSSTFNFSGGEIIVDKGKIEISPASSSVDPSAAIKLGNTSTIETLTAEIVPEIGKLELLSASSVNVNIEINDLNLLGDLEIPSGTTLNLNSKNLYSTGNIINSGTLNASTSIITMLGTDEQLISGTSEISTQHFVVNTEGGTVKLANNINVIDDMDISAGTISDENYSINVGGDLSVTGTHSTVGVNGRIKLNGTSSQALDIKGSVGRVELDNVNGIYLTDNLNLVADEIIFTNGVLNINKYGLNLSSAVTLTATTIFDENNMIQFSGGVDAQGVTFEFPNSAINSEKIIPVGYAGTYAPVGFVGHYEGVSVAIKPINTMHTIAANQGLNNDALDQYWRFDFSETGNNTGDRYVTLYYDESNVNGTEGDYIGVIIGDDELINKPIQFEAIDIINDKIKIDLTTKLLSGDYFAGHLESTPENILRYKLVNSVVDANLDEVGVNKWEVSSDNGANYLPLENDASPVLASGTIIEIPAGTKLTSTADGDLGFRTYYKAIINGTLEVGVDDKQINFNAVEGNGIIKFYVNNASIGQMPNANWEDFYNSGGSIIVEGDATNTVLSLNAPIDNEKLKIDGLTLIGTGANQLWALPDGNGLEIQTGTLTINNLEFDITSTSILNDIVINNNGILTTNSASLVNGDMDVQASGNLNVESSSFIIKGNTTVSGNLNITSSLLDVEDITFASGSNVSLTSAAELAVAGDFSYSGASASFTGSTLTFDGISGNQNFNGQLTSAEGSDIDNLIINNQTGQVINDGQRKDFTNLTLNSILNNYGNGDKTIVSLGGTTSGSSYVYGPLTCYLNVGESYLFYAGGYDKQMMAEVSYTSNDAGASQKPWTVEYLETADIKDETIILGDALINEVSPIHQWRISDIDPDLGGTQSSTASVHLYYGDGMGLENADKGDLRLGMWTFDLNGDAWKENGSSLSKSTYLEGSGISFSEKFVSISTVGTFNNDIDDVVADLPVELISFEAEVEDQKVNLYWSTASEINNAYFVVQRSVDKQTWTSIGEVEGAGNSDVTLYYTFTDEEGIHGDISYYRLVQYDFDGTNTVIDPVSVYLDADSEKEDLTIFPNPTQGKDKINILLKSWKNDVQIDLYNTLGYKVQSANWDMGNNPIKEFKINKLPRGVYILRAKSGKTIVSKRIIVE